MNNKIIHEADSVDDIFQIAKGLAAISTNLGNKSKPVYSHSSLAKAASKLTTVFPILASRTVSKETAQMVCKYTEQKACGLFMLALQQANVVTAKSGIEYLRNFHQNLEDSGTADTLIKNIETWLDAYDKGSHHHESASLLSSRMQDYEASETSYDYLFESEDLNIDGHAIKDLMRILKENENIQIYDTELNPMSINDIAIKESGNGQYRMSIRRYSALNEAINRDLKMDYTGTDMDWLEHNYDGGYLQYIEDDIRLRRNQETRDQNDERRRQAKEDREAQAHVWAANQEIRAQNKDARERRKEELEIEKNMRERESHDWARNQERRNAAREKRDEESHGWARNKEDRDAETHRWAAAAEKEYSKAAQAKDQRDDMRAKIKQTNLNIEKTKQDMKLAKDRDKRERRKLAIDVNRYKSDMKQIKDETDAQRASYNTSVLKDQDIKKMNDAVPALLVVKFYQSTDARVATEFLIGVKSKVIPVTTAEIIRRVVNDNDDRQSFLKLMRTITGELKVSELLLGLSRIKDDIKSTRIKGTYGDTWNLLKNRAAAAKEQVAHGNKNDFSAITTVLISRADADELFREENIDIMKIKVAKHFMESYNLLGLIIADDATETLNMLYDDGGKTFEEVSYTMLERESKDGTYKKLINLMAAQK